MRSQTFVHVDFVLLKRKSVKDLDILRTNSLFWSLRAKAHD